MGENCGSHQHGECCGGSSKHEMKEQKHESCGCESEKKKNKDSCCG